MEQLKREIEEILTARFPDVMVELEEVPLVEKLSGHVITGEFSGKSQRERSKLLWQVLREKLDAKQQQLLSVILTFSPAEYRAIVKFG